LPGDDLWLNAGITLAQLARRRALLADLIAAGVAHLLDQLTADENDESEDSTLAGRRQS
jgi:hypothetical protein